MTANVITYRERSAAREIGKVLGIPLPEVDRLATHPAPLRVRRPHGQRCERRLARGAASTGDDRAGAALRAPLRRDPGPAAPPGPALGRDGDRAGRARRRGAAGAGHMPGRVVVQWDKDDCADLGIVKVDLLGLGMMAALQDSLVAAGGRRASTVDLAHLPAGRPEGLRDAAAGRHRGRVPGREPRADGDAAAHEARRTSTTWWSRSRSSGPGPSWARWCTRTCDRRAGREPVTYAHPQPGADPEAHAGRAALPGAAPAHGHDRGRLHRRRGRGAAPGDGLQALGEAHGATIEVRLRAGMAANGITGADRGRDRPLDHLVRALRLPRVARGVSFALLAYASAYLQGAPRRRRSCARCSTTSPWASTTRSRW